MSGTPSDEIRALRLWHMERALRAANLMRAAAEQLLEFRTEDEARRISRRIPGHRRRYETALRAVRALDALFPAGDTVERDIAEGRLSAKNLTLY